MKKGNKLTIDFGRRTSFGFHGIALNYFVKHVLKLYDDRKTTEIFFRLYRTGLLGDLLYKAGLQKVKKENEAKNQFYGVLFESYIFLVRTLYDYLLHFLKQHHKKTRYSFYDFSKDIKKGKYPGIKGRLREYLNGGEWFEELRALRDSIKEKTAGISVYVKEGRYRVTGTIYNRAGTITESFDETLELRMFKCTAGLFILMTYIAQLHSGKTLKEQREIMEREVEEF